MILISAVQGFLSSAPCQKKLAMLYGSGASARQAERYLRLAEWFARLYPNQTGVRFFSAPGRAEIGGNHTDHQLGRVLAASIHLDTLAAVAPNNSMVVRLHSDGFDPVSIDLAQLSLQEGERETTAAVIRGCAARMQSLGHPIGGFDAAVASSVLKGSGLSSSAAFEVLICAVFGSLFGKGILPPIESAKISQYAENNYFGKPSGLLDQMTSAFGGLVTIDFAGKEPAIRALKFDFLSEGCAMVVVNTGGSHDNLTDAYAAIPQEMKQVAAFFGEEHLRSVDPSRLEAATPALRQRVSDRAILRAMHFFDENQRVAEQVEALEAGDFERFMRLVVASGESSWMLLQNVWASPAEQPVSLALALAGRLLAGRGAYRVHGGGFAGTILAFVPDDLVSLFSERMEQVYGKDSICPLMIRPVGAYELDA